ncbi:MAG: M3 family oligoendopeptidase [Planctomycetota bacterium]
MKFDEIAYQRPDIKEVAAQFDILLGKLDGAKTNPELDSAMEAVNQLRSEFESMGAIVYIRHTVDTADQFYKKEQDYFDQTGPHYGNLVTKYYKALIKSRHRPYLEKKWGKQLFVLAELAEKTFKPEIIEDLQQENKLSTEYTQLLASAKILFEGQERTLSQMVPFIISPDRAMRKKAAQAKYGFFVQNETKLDEIYDNLVKIRVAIARKLGFKDFVELGYARMCRSDYNADMVANFREQVKEYIVPIASKLRQAQRLRLGLDALKYYDEPLSFTDGNATPKGPPEWIIDNGKKMYSELSPETKEFFDFMVDRGLLDLLSKKDKAGGGYCTYLSKYKYPYIFANFNGTAGDINVLTHEAGHAFQAYRTKDLIVPEYHSPTAEACEIHSMSMEFFTWPWMELFFKEDIKKYKFSHLGNALLFMPYGVAVDEFQHYVYSNPGDSPAQRKAAWRRIEKKYLPHRDYEDNAYLENGGFWHQQMHIFGMPFYYIDYTLAQMCAFQFWKKSLEAGNSAWTDYLKLCAAGGSKSFLELVKLANLISPFEDGCVKSVIGLIESRLDDLNPGKHGSASLTILSLPKY